MRRWKDRPPLLRGRLHGRSLKALAGIAAAAVAIALWQFTLGLFGEGERDVADWSVVESLSQDPRPTSGDASESAPDEASPSEETETTPPKTEDSSEPAPDTVATSSDEPSPMREEPGCTATLTVDNEWSDTVAVSVDVVNTGDDPISGWSIVLDFDHAEVTSAWGMEHQDGDRWMNAFYNGQLDSGDTAAPSFHASVDGDADLPGTVPCRPDS